MSHVVIFTPRGELYLVRVKRSKDGRVKTGHVMNGGWDFEIRGNRQLAKAGNYIVNEWPDAPSAEIDVPESVNGNYNEVLAWAREQKAKQ